MVDRRLRPRSRPRRNESLAHIPTLPRRTPTLRKFPGVGIPSLPDSKILMACLFVDFKIVTIDIFNFLLLMFVGDEFFSFFISVFA